MALRFFSSRSLQTRITATTLTLFLVSLWSLSYYVQKILYDDLRQLLSQQQYATATMVAAHLNDELDERLTALQKTALFSAQALLKGPAAIQEELNHRPILRSLFNSGVFVCSLDGSTVANSLSSEQLCNDYINISIVTAALREGRSTIGQLTFGKNRHEAHFGIATPIRDDDGKIIGALAGMINVNQPNFLDKITKNTYGATGGYLIVSPKYRRIISATNKNRVMEAVPAVGINPTIDQFIQGYEGSAIMKNPGGIEVLVSAKSIPAADWIVAAALPTAEAFAPIKRIQTHIQFAAIFFTLLAALVSWWVLRRQLAPLRATIKTLDNIAENKQARQALPITRQDEIGQLISAFNRLLKILGQQELALKHNEAFNRTILDSVSAEIAVLNRDGIIIMVNQPWRRFALENAPESGKPSAKTDIGTNYLDICMAGIGNSTHDDDDGLICYQGIQAALEGKASGFTMEYPCDSPGKPRWFSMVVTQLNSESSTHIEGVVVTHTDITDRKNLEEALQLTRQSVSVASDALLWVTPDARIVDANKAAYQLLGYTREELLNLHPSDICVSFQHDAEQWPLFFDSLREHGVIKLESLYSAKNGKIFPVEIVVNYVQYGSKEFSCAFIRDITQRKLIETELIDAKAQAEKANSAKSHFLAAASHDLRQPLSALSLYVDVLKQGTMADKGRILDNIQQCVTSLSEILSDLLDISKLDAGVITPKLNDFSIDELISKLIAVYSSESSLKKLELRIRPSGLLVHSDHRLLYRIVGNFIANAIHYTETGGLLIACRKHQGKYWLQVWDTGIGVPEDKTSIIFEEFTQLGNDTGNEGSGLGLAIAAKMAALLGLQIKLCSRSGRGSMFAIELPTLGLEKQEKLATEKKSASLSTIAIVEDNIQIRQSLSLSLESAGYKVIAASSGEKLFERLGHQTPDLIISDYRLNDGTTGVDVIAKCRNKFGTDFPAIIITGETDPELIRSMLDRGIPIIYKPLELGALQKLVATITG